jgi:tripartite-type tricarboxylate transporter receptor subunit TctC
MMRTLITRCFMTMATIAMSVAALPASAQSGAWPNKPMRLIVPFAAGGSADLMGRYIGKHFSEAFGQPVVVENRLGAGGMLGSDVVAKAAPDGYTLLLGIAATHAIQPALGQPMPYDVVRDFAPIGQVAFGAMALTVPIGFPANNLREFIDYARANPGKINYGTGGLASGGHLVGEALNALSKTGMTHIPYKGGSPAFNDMLGGQLQVVLTDTSTTAGFVQMGKVKVLAVSGPKRSPAFPTVPTLLEQGVQFEPGSWFAMFAPAGTPPAILARLNAELNNFINQKEMNARMVTMGLTPAPGDVASFQRVQQADIAAWTRIVKSAGIKVE